MTVVDRARDSYGSWSLAIACLREQGIRSGKYWPINETERRQAAEGPVDVRRLSSLEAA